MDSSKKDQEKLNVILLVINKKLTQKEAALELEITERHFRRILKKYKEEGEKSLIHKNIGQPSHNKKIPVKIATEIMNNYLTEYSDYGFTHFYEEQGYKYGISFSAMLNIFVANEIISPYAQHKTFKLYNENMKNAIKEEIITESQKSLFEQRKKEELEKHIRKSTLHYSFGQEVQMDAAFWIWFGDEESALHLAVDKATKKVLYGWFDYEETTKSYMIILFNIIIIYGIPYKIRTDKRSSFSINNARSSKSKINVTQFKRICDDLEIDLSCSSNPLYKPNAERENGTFKRRLKAELRHEGITEKEEATKYLNEVFIPKMNKRFSYDINPKKNLMRENTYSKEQLNVIISIRNERTIDNASSIKYYNNYYLPINQETGEIVSFKSGTKCTVVNTYDEKLLGIINEQFYDLCLVEKQEKNCDKDNSSKNGYKPKDNHPWKKDMMLNKKISIYGDSPQPPKV